MQMDPNNSFKDIRDSISGALVSTTRSASHLSNEDLGFHRSIDRSVATTLDRQNGRLLRLAQGLLANAAAASDVVGPALTDRDSVESDWKGIVDVIDSLLEKVDTSLDEFTGAVKRLSPGADQVTLC
jgi:exosome complex exonuclease RRP6